MDFVLDCSVAVAWVLNDESSAEADGWGEVMANGQSALAPVIWPLEMANVLLVAERRKRITPDEGNFLLTRLEALPISVESGLDLSQRLTILSLARRNRLSAYDAAYLETSLRCGLPLATLDDRLKRAARDTGVAVSFVGS